MLGLLHSHTLLGICKCKASGKFCDELLSFGQLIAFSPTLKNSSAALKQSLTRRTPARPQGLQLGSLGLRTFTTYESNIAFVMRYMVDAGIVGANWVALPAGSYLLRGAHGSNVQIEADVMWQSLVSHAPDGEWLRVGPLRILSFDIECAGRKGFFPEAEQDPVIQIANWVSVQVIPCRGFGLRAFVLQNRLFPSLMCIAVRTCDKQDFACTG